MWLEVTGALQVQVVPLVDIAAVAFMLPPMCRKRLTSRSTQHKRAAEIGMGATTLQTRVRMVAISSASIVTL